MEKQDVWKSVEEFGFRVQWCDKVSEEEFELFALNEKGVKYLARVYIREVGLTDVEELISKLYDDIKGVIVSPVSVTSNVYDFAKRNNILVYDKSFFKLH